jgi:hypothetical protein
VPKTAVSQTAAERALKAELTVRRAPGGTGALADAWLTAELGWSTGTEHTYRSTVRAQVIPASGRLCLREVTPGTVTRALATIAKTSGPGATKTDGPSVPVADVRSPSPTAR